MIGYLYIAIISISLFYTIIRDIYLFNTGQYNPYPFKEKKIKRELPVIVRFGIPLILMWIALSLFMTNIKLLPIMTIIFLCYSFCLITCADILNYLSYKNIKDPKIISQTIIFNIMVIVISIGLWKTILM